MLQARAPWNQQRGRPGAGAAPRQAGRWGSADGCGRCGQLLAHLAAVNGWRCGSRMALSCSRRPSSVGRPGSARTPLLPQGGSARPWPAPAPQGLAALWAELPSSSRVGSKLLTGFRRSFALWVWHSVACHLSPSWPRKQPQLQQDAPGHRWRPHRAFPVAPLGRRSPLLRASASCGRWPLQALICGWRGGLCVRYLPVHRPVCVHRGRLRI